MDVNWLSGGSSSSGFIWMGGHTIDPDSSPRPRAVIGPPNFKSIWWLESALKASRSVARIKLPNGAATGFLVKNNLLLTNNHVFENAEDTVEAKIQFNYRMTADDQLAPVDEWRCDPDTGFITNKALDYSLVRLAPKNGKNAGDTWGTLDIEHGQTIFPNSHVNIIQHPQGRFQEIAFRDNQVKLADDVRVQYLTDTEFGSSGSPVFDDRFHVIALHSQRIPDPADPDRWYRNEGFRVSAIVSDAAAFFSG